MGMMELFMKMIVLWVDWGLFGVFFCRKCVLVSVRVEISVWSFVVLMLCVCFVVVVFVVFVIVLFVMGFIGLCVFRMGICMIVIVGVSRLSVSSSVLFLVSIRVCVVRFCFCVLGCSVYLG